MKKLLFSLVAAAACGAVTADNVPATATFDSLTAEATFDVGKTEAQTVEIDGDNLGYWAVNMATDPELTVKAKSESDKYLSLNTGSTPLWRTFTGIGVVDSAKAGTLPAGVDADGKVVSSDVKLTACTEWPTLTDFANEKLALFLFAKEEGDTSGKDSGLYAVGGAMVDPDGEGEAVAALTRTAYKLTVSGDITNAQGWATISIKTYGDIYKNSGADKLAGFVIAVNGKIATRAEATGFTADDLGTTAATRNTDGTLIPAAMTTTAATIAGLGFQGEGGIDNVNLFADDFATDAVTMSVSITGEATVAVTAGGTLDNGTITFNPGATVKFTVSSSADIVNVTYSGKNALSYDENTKVYSVVAEADAVITVTASAAAFQIGGVKYADFAAVLTAIENETITGGEIDLLADASAGEDGLEFNEGEYTIDLNGFTLSAVDDGDAIYNNGAILTIIDSSELKTGVVAGTVYNNKGTLVIEAGTFNDEITNKSTLTINGGKFEVALDNTGTLTDNGGEFKDTTGLPEVTGKEYRDDNDDDYYTLEDEAGSEPETPVVPSIPEADGDVVVDETTGNATVTVDPDKEGDVVVTVPSGFTGAIAAVVPPTVGSISGVPAASITVKVGTLDITGAFTKTTTEGKVTLALNEEGSVVVGDETINVKPDLADGKEETPFVVGDTTAATVKTIPGLKYSLVWDSDLGFAENSETKGGTTPATATSSRMTLTDDTPAAQKPSKRFYKVKVTTK